MTIWSDNRLTAKIGESQELRNALISVCVIDTEDNSIVHSYNAEKSMTPASILKLLTTATAMELWGENYQFETQITHDGYIDPQGILHGNIYIMGSGDPSLGSEYIIIPADAFLKNSMVQIKKAGIKQVTGNIISDATLFDIEGVSPKWLWEDLGNYYAAGCYGVNYIDNQYRLLLKSGEPNTPVTVTKTVPPMADIRFTSYLKAKNNHVDSAYIYGMPFDSDRYILGTIPAYKETFTIKGDIPNPPLYLAGQLKEALALSGITVTGVPQSLFEKNKSNTSNLKTIYIHRSPTLLELATVTNMRSHNLYAEALLRLISLKKFETGSALGGIEVLKEFWQKKGIDLTSLTMYDGAGIAPINKISAQTLAKILSKATPYLYKTLPIAGKNGTVRSFMKNAKLSGTLKLKSGSMAQVACYAGYYDTPKRYAVVVMANNFTIPRREMNNKISQILEDILIDIK